MRDGTQIAVDAFVPTVCWMEPCEPPFPVVFQYSPYQRATEDPLDAPFTGEVNDAFDQEYVRFLLSNGYAFVNADMRGSGASSGWRYDFMPEKAGDGQFLTSLFLRCYITGPNNLPISPPDPSRQCG